MAQFNIEDGEITYRWDKNKFRRGLIEPARRGFICSNAKKLETKSSEIICSEIMIGKMVVNIKYGSVSSVYRPPLLHIRTFFEKLENFESKAYIKYDQFIIIGDFKINVEKPECLG